MSRGTASRLQTSSLLCVADYAAHRTTESSSTVRTSLAPKENSIEFMPMIVSRRSA
jgi:hypothetical protein